MSSDMQSYSLWLEPANGTLKTKLEARISGLAAQHKGPLFKPHVTLVPGYLAPSDEAAVSNARAAVKDLKAYRIDLDRVSHGSPFFQCVYVLCKCTPEVMNANKVAARALGFGPGGSYMPHLSLLYSAADEETRRSVAESEQRLLTEDAESDAEQLGYDVKSVSVWSTEPGDLSLKSWKKLADVPLLP